MTQEAMSMFAAGLEANTRLTDLFFTHNNLQEAGEAGLAFIKSLSNKKDLRSLALNSCNLNGEYLVALQDAVQGHRELRELYLFANKIEAEEGKHIAAILKGKSKLTCLGLSNNKLGATGACYIADDGLKGNACLVKLSIENNGISNAGLESLSEALKLNNSLQEIYLYNNDIDDDPINSFVAMLAKQPDLFAVGLEFNRLGYKAVELLTKALVKHPKLEKLYLN